MKIHKIVASRFMRAFMLLLVFYCSQLPVQASNDLFSNLEILSIGDVIDGNLLQLGKLSVGISTNTKTYTFTSSRYSHPHILDVDANSSKLTFLQLTIPAELYVKYNLNRQSLGAEEVYLPKTETEVVYAYPSRGISFISSHKDGDVIRVQKYPVKDMKNYMTNEGKNYLPVDKVVRATVARRKDQSSAIYITLTIIGLLVILIGIIIVYLLKKWNHPPLTPPPIHRDFIHTSSDFSDN